MGARWESILRRVTLVAVALALYAALVATPPDAVTGERVRVLYVHVGAAWTAYLAYGTTAAAAMGFLWRRARRWDRVALAAAEWGFLLTSLTLLTGMLWGRASQGWWWRWSDARLTLTLLLWFLYVGYLILRQYTAGERQAVLSAVLAVAAVPAMVLNHFAVRLFPAFHPAPVALRAGGPALDPPFVTGLLLAVVAFSLVYLSLLLERVRLEVRRDRLAGLDGGGRGAA